MNTEKIALLIKTLRQKDNLTQNEFAKKYGVTYQAVSKWEKPSRCCFTKRNMFWT